MDRTLRRHYIIVACLSLIMILSLWTIAEQYTEAKQHRTAPTAGCKWSWQNDGGRMITAEDTAYLICHHQRCTVTAVCR